ncbi:hypothetical protein DPEC_G00007700 [Dallia pectoralis]|uniref:Uncharacterized protein n=1 Tax=Dallia pectoralis TaxID=75939 RepID=A0ACC2HKE8_DALPE|nr:hypothetical protein DPEC_G00007700 [Dallia pectoralis]
MDDNKHSVNVSECDWESLQVCTDRDLLPSGLAGLDSGISDTSVSDTDNAGSLSLDRSLQAKLGERSPVEHFLNRHGVGCLENVLSGSEDEDVHLESINRFFERLKSLPVDEQRTDHCQATPELRDKVAQVCVDGPQAKDSTLPISNTEFHFLSATSGPDNTNALKKNRTDFQMTPEIPVSDAREGEKDKSTNPKVELVISDDWLLVTATTNDAKRQKYEGQSCEILKVVLEMSADSLRSAASGKMLNLQLAVCQRVDDERHRKIPTDQTFLRKSLDSCANPRKDSSSNVVVGPGAMVTAGEYPAAQRESSMNQSLSTTKRKRRRKKRVSMEPVDEGQRPFLANRDSDDEKCVLGSEMDAHVQISRHYTASCEHDSESFWNEMEKLTIKDILQLRTVSNAQHSSVNLKPTKSETVDISKAISDNQGYFSYVDDSKPDCSSGDRSITSTIADEFSQNPTVDNPSTDSIKNNESTNSIGIFGESKLDASSYKAGLYSENVPALSSISNIPKPHSSACTQPDFRRISKNVSVQNLLALGAEPLRRVLKGQSSTSVILVEEKPGIDSCGDGNTGCLAYNGSVRQDSSMDTLPAVNISKGVSTGSNRFFTEVKKFFFGSKKPEARPPSPDNMSTYYVNSGSVPEYEHFCSEFDEGGFSHPIKDAFGNRKNNLVPIYSCSRLDKHNLQFPEAYDYLFSSDSSSDSGEEDSCSPIRMITRLNQRPDETQGFTVAQDMYENVFTDDDPSENFFWNTNLSLRKIGLVGSTNQKRGSDSLSRVPLINNKRPYIRSIESISVLGSEDKTFSDQLLYSVEGKLFRQLAEQQRRYPDLQVAVANPRFDASLIPLKQSDMCLVCIAFASWVLKSTNPDAGDTWKAVILANLSALSAIRYLRRSKATGEKPKTQNTSAIV